MLELGVGKRLRDLDRRIPVPERGREDEVVPRDRKLADHALGIGALGHVLNIFRRDLAAQRLFHFLAAEVVLIRPAGVADRAHVDEADLERLAGLGLRGGGQRQRYRAGGHGRERHSAGSAVHRYLLGAFRVMRARAEASAGTNPEREGQGADFTPLPPRNQPSGWNGRPSEAGALSLITAASREMIASTTMVAT